MKLGEYIDLMATEASFWLLGARDPGYPLEQLGDLSLEISDSVRGLAIAVLLARADTNAFLHNLIRSGNMRETYLRRCMDAGLLDDYHRGSGRYGPLLDAIASGDLGLAQRIVELSPTDWRSGCEYEDDYCYAQIIHRWVLGAWRAAEVTPLFDRFEAFAGGDSPRIAVCSALLAQDQRAFDEAFDLLLDAREEEVEAEKARGQPEEPAAVAQRLVFVEGLALLRIAEGRGIRTKLDYPMCPSLARLSMTEPFPGL